MKSINLERIKWDGSKLVFVVELTDNIDKKELFFVIKDGWRGAQYKQKVSPDNTPDKKQEFVVDFKKFDFKDIKNKDLSVELHCKNVSYKIKIHSFARKMPYYVYALNGIFQIEDRAMIPLFSKKGQLGLYFENEAKVMLKMAKLTYYKTDIADVMIKKDKLSFKINNFDIGNYENALFMAQSLESKKCYALKTKYSNQNKVEAEIPLALCKSNPDHYQFFLFTREGRIATYIELPAEEIIKAFQTADKISGGKELYMFKTKKLIKKDCIFSHQVMVKGNYSIRGLMYEQEFKGNRISLSLGEYFFNKNTNAKIVLIEKLTLQREEYHVSAKDLLSQKKVTIDLTNFIEKIETEIRGNKSWYIFAEVEHAHQTMLYRLGSYYSSTLSRKRDYLHKIPIHGDFSVCMLTNAKNFMLVSAIPDENQFQTFNRIKTTNVSVRGSMLRGKMIIESDKAKPVAFLIRGRKTENQVIHESDFKAKLNSNGHYIIHFKMDFDKYTYDQFYYDLYIQVEYNGELVLIRVKNSVLWLRQKFKYLRSLFIYNIDDYIIYPYRAAGGALSLMYRAKTEYDTLKFTIKEIMACGLYFVFKNRLINKNIWLAYEKFSNAAQDNGYYFYKHCMKAHPNRKLYFVIDKRSPDMKNLKGLEKKLINFMSVKHLLYLLAATMLLSSESKVHCYAFGVLEGKFSASLKQKRHIFLQHGVTAMKRVDYVFQKGKKNGVDLFVVCSDFEKKIIMDEFKYNEDEVIITGFSRWDVLENDPQEKRLILLMPTWRTWLDGLTSEEFTKTEYFQNYMKMINSPYLENYLKENNLEMNYYVHPKFKMYVGEFATDKENIRLIQYGDTPLNKLIMKSSMLITDYSSVAFDAFYMKKPVLFYHFDVDEYNLNQGSYIDFDTELFGDRAFTNEELIALIEAYAENDFVEKPVYGEMRKKYFKYVDKNNSERIYSEIEKRKWLYHS